MRWGIGTFTYPWSFGISGYSPQRKLTLEELIERAFRFGARIVQISHNFPLHELSEQTLREVKSYADQRSVSIEIGTAGINRSHLMTYLDIAGILGSPFVRTILDTQFCEPSINEAVQEISAVIPAFSEAGVMLLIENHDKRTKEDMMQLIECIGSPFLGLCFDTANSLGAFEDPRSLLREIAPYVVNVHLKDVAIFRNNYQLGFIIEGRPLGEGKLGIHWVFEILGERREKVTYIIELLTPFQGSVEGTVRQEELWAEKSISFLKGVMS